MSKLPNGWSLKKLGALGEFRTSSVDKKIVEGEDVVRLLNYMDIYRNNFITSDKIESSTSAKENQITSSEVRLGDVFFTPSSETPEDIGHSGVVIESLNKTVFSYHLSRFRIFENEVFDLRFRGYAFNAEYIRKQFYIKATGSTRFTISKEEFEKTIVKYPTDINEQKKIAEILTSVDYVIELTSQEIDKLKDLKKGMMQELLSKGIGHTKFKDSSVGEIPESWEVVSCNEVCREICVGIVIKPSQYYKTSGVPAFRSANVRENKINDKNFVYLSKEDNEILRKSKVFNRDLLTVRTGYPGTTCIVDSRFDGSNCVDVIISRPKHDIVLSEFLCNWINSDYGRGQVLKYQGGLAQQHFNVGELKEMLIPLPTLKEQKLIIRNLHSIEQLTEKKEYFLENTINLKKGLMNDLLTGKVRVKL